MTDTFNALVVRDSDDGPVAGVEELTDADLPDGDVTVEIDYSSLNYKDGMALTGAGRIIRSFPMVPGIDFAGSVTASTSDRFEVGDGVILTGWGVGERHWGGYSQRQRTRSEWLVARPDSMTSRQAMGIGTAGLTAMLCVMALEQGGVTPADGRVVVTGAAGGVGSVAIALLAALGFEVTAVTGRPEQEDYLRSLGATAFLTREEMTEAPKPLESETWAGAVDAVGSTMLAKVIAQTSYRGVVTACGLAGGIDLPTTVMPFILRGVRLQGIDSVMAPLDVRDEAWARLATDLPDGMLDAMIEEVPMSEILDRGPAIMAGQTRGSDRGRPERLMSPDDHAGTPGDAGIPAGADPLLAQPKLATGETGQMERPGDDRPGWIVPLFFVCFVGLIAGLAAVAISRADDDAGSVASSEPASSVDSAGDDDASAGDDDASAGDDDAPTGETAAPSSGSAEPSTVVELPAAGFARLGGVDVPIESSCVDHLPLAPNDVVSAVSSYFFRDADGVSRVADRRVGERDEQPASLSGYELVAGSFVEPSEPGAFAAEFVDTAGREVALAVHPSPGAGLDCANTLVTNEPGQFAFPYTRIVLFACAVSDDSGDAGTAGITSEGGYFEAIANREVGDDEGSFTLAYRNPEFAVALVDEAASGFDGDGRLGVSGVVRGGDVAFDITVDVPIDEAAPCSDADRV